MINEKEEIIKQANRFINESKDRVNKLERLVENYEKYIESLSTYKTKIRKDYYPKDSTDYKDITYVTIPETLICLIGKGE
jgi:hypothetical protein